MAESAQFAVPVRLPAYTAATLPTCNSGQIHTLAAVTDAVNPTFRSAVVGGGATYTLVYCDGNGWTAH